MIKKRYYFLYMLAPLVILLIILFTSTDVLEVFHFIQNIEGNQEKFSINRKDLNKFQNILITSDESSHFSGFNWIIKSKNVKQDFYLSFKKSKKEENKGDSSSEGIPDFTISTGKDRIKGYFGISFKLYKPEKPNPALQNITLRIDYFPVPWNLVLVVLACAVLQGIVLYAASRFLRRKSISLKPLVYTAAITNILLVFRLLFAYKAYLHYPFSIKSYSLSLWALFLVPLFLFICFILQTSGFFGKLGDWIKKSVYDNYGRQFQLLLTVFIIPAIFKGIIGMGREAITGSKRFALSIFFVPYLIMAGAATLCFIFYWFFKLKDKEQVDATFLSGIRVRVNDRIHSLNAFLLVLLLLLVYLFIGLKDKGFLLLYIPPFIIVCAICISILNIKGKKRSWVRLLLLTIGYGGLAGILLFLLFPGKLTLLGYNLTKFKLSTGVETREIGNSFELQRTLSSIDSPLILHNFSTKTWTQMEELDKVKQYLEYSKTNGGYFRVIVDKSLGPRALHDYAAAVFLISEFGTFWVLIVLLLFSCFAFIPLLLRKKLPADAENRYGISFLIFIITGFTLFYSALYMIGGNLFLFPFSGKNVYLWGLDSGSDLVEAALLLGIFIISYAQCRDIKPAKSKWGSWGRK